MSIPYNNCLRLDQYLSNPDWYEDLQDFPAKEQSQIARAAGELFMNVFEQPIVRAVQLIRDTLRLVLKVPIRALTTPIFLEENWHERERAKINAKLTGYAFVQLVSVPVKFLCALVALGISMLFPDKAKEFLDQSEEWTAHIDGRTSQLEALKEEGAKKCQNQEDFNAYKDWLYEIDPKLCRKV